MKISKTIQRFRKSVYGQKTRVAVFLEISNFEELAGFATELGFSLSADQLRAHAEGIVDERRQDLEQESSFQSLSDEEPRNSLLARLFLKSNRIEEEWNDQMCKLCYYVDDPNYDSFARMKEKGG